MKNNWISVKDRLPDDCIEVLGWINGNSLMPSGGYVDVLIWNDGKWVDPKEYCEIAYSNDVTHWQPLEPPKKVE